MGFTLPQTEVVDVEPGAYDGVITACELVKGQFGPQVKFKIKLSTGDTLPLYTSTAFNPRSKLWAVVAGAFGREPGRGVAFQSDWMPGRRVRVLVGQHQRQDGTIGSRIEAVLLPGAAAPEAAVMVPAERAVMPAAVPAQVGTVPAAPWGDGEGMPF